MIIRKEYEIVLKKIITRLQPKKKIYVPIVAKK